MICRELKDDCWAFISQVEHARIAAELAARWGYSLLPELCEPEKLIPAIRFHDQGWQEWETAPEVDPASGKPRDFLNMEMEDSTRIWSRSIEYCFDPALNPDASPEAGIWVSRHFCKLAEGAAQHRRNSKEPSATEEIQLLEEFLSSQSALQRRLIELTGRPKEEELFENGFQWVQTFDLLSLWLCCAEREEPQSLDCPSGFTLQLIPQNQTTIQMTPWPFTEMLIPLEVNAPVLHARTFPSDAEFQSALRRAETQTIRWRLIPEV